MTDKAVQAQERVTKLEASIERLRKEVADRKAHIATAAHPERHRKPLEDAEGRLARAIEKLPQAKERAAEIAISERKRNAKRKRLQAATVAIGRRLDALREGAAEVDARWRHERKAEPRIVKRLTKKIRDRTTKDQRSSTAEWRRRPVRLPPPIEQPEPDAVSVTLTPETLPDRPDLMPGTFKMMDPARLAPLLDEDPLPPSWTWRHVGRRLLDAFDTIRVLPEKDKPKTFGSMWPSYRPEAGDLAHQAGQGTLARPTGRRSVSAVEVELMEEAIEWPLQFLNSLPDYNKQWLMFWLNDPNSELDSGTAPKEYFEAIATALNAAHEVVR